MFALSLPKGILKHIFMEKPIQSETSFWARLRTALSCFNRALANPDFCRQAAELLRPPQPQASPKPVELPPNAFMPPAWPSFPCSSGKAG